MEVRTDRFPLRATRTGAHRPAPDSDGEKSGASASPVQNIDRMRLPNGRGALFS